MNHALPLLKVGLILKNKLCTKDFLLGIVGCSENRFFKAIFLFPRKEVRSFVRAEKGRAAAKLCGGSEFLKISPRFRRGEKIT